jgi:hypothetical protein
VELRELHSALQGPCPFALCVTYSFKSLCPIRFHPHTPTTLYTILNTTPPRTRKTKTTTRPAFVVKWSVSAPADITDVEDEKDKESVWEVGKVRKVGEKGVTCFDVRCVLPFVTYISDVLYDTDFVLVSFVVPMDDSLLLGPLIIRLGYWTRIPLVYVLLFSSQISNSKVRAAPPNNSKSPRIPTNDTTLQPDVQSAHLR